MSGKGEAMGVRLAMVAWVVLLSVADVLTAAGGHVSSRAVLAAPSAERLEEGGSASGTEATAADTLRYVELVEGRVLGERRVWREGGDTLGVSYRTGRQGWTRTERLVLGPDGLPVYMDVQGDILPGVHWHEGFERGERARWFTPLREDEAEVSGPAYYAPVRPAHGPGVVARALLRRESRTLPLLPAGRVRLERLEERTVGAGGRSRTLRLYALHGLDLLPTYVWLDQEGATFAGEWTVLAGWEEAFPELRAAVDSAVASHRRSLGRELVPPARTRPLAIRGARLFDAETGRVLEGRTVVVEGGRIVAVGPDAEVRVPEAAERIEAGGRTLLPGLWDMHAHNQIPRTLTEEVRPLLDLASGVTTSRDLASHIERLSSLRAAIDAGEAVGPRILPVGLIDGADGEALGDVILVDGSEQARGAVDRFAELGYVQVKTYNSVPADAVKAVIARAEHHGLRVSGHVPFAMSTTEAVRAGYDELHHLWAVLASLPMSWDEAGARGWTMERLHPAMAELTTDSDAVEELVRLLAARGVAIDATLGLYTSTGVPPEFVEEDVDRLPPVVARRLSHAVSPYEIASVPVSPLSRPAWARTVANMRALVPVLRDAGVPLVVGTDTWPGFALYHELELMVEAGIPAPEVLTLATLGAARVMGMAEDVGSIEPGKRADLILVDGDPTTRIADIRRVVTVVKGGRVYAPAAIYRALGVEPCCGK